MDGEGQSRISGTHGASCFAKRLIEWKFVFVEGKTHRWKK